MYYQPYLISYAPQGRTWCIASYWVDSTTLKQGLFHFSLDKKKESLDKKKYTEFLNTEVML